MSSNGITGIIIIIANVVFSYKGFTNKQFFEGYKFEVDKIFINKDYKRLITSSFLHVSWIHLIFNMITLFAFSGSVENHLGGMQFLVIYFASMLGGDLFCLLIHKNHGNYSSVGASGAVCGIIFASIALFPNGDIGFFGIPISIPSWIYGVFYVLYSVYGIKSKKGNIGHEAHLGGALVGMIAAILFEPQVLQDNLATILYIAIPTIIFIYIIVRHPHFLLVDNFFFKTHHKAYTIDQKYNLQRKIQQNEVDRILDKINRTGMQSLSKKEKQTLKEYAQKI